MTLGPAILLLPFLEQPTSRLARALEVFGRVPMFYYLLHIPLIHVLAMIMSVARSGTVSPWLFENHPMGMSPPPPDYVWRLWQLYLVTVVAIVLLYPACRWFGEYKRTSRSRFVSYL